MSLRITFVIHSLGGGGAERATALLCNELDVRGHSVTVITLDSSDANSYPISEKVQQIALGLTQESRNIFHAIGNNFTRLRHLRRSILESQPDRVVSVTHENNILTLLSLLGCRLRPILWDQIDPREYDLGFIRSLLRRLLYPRCRSLVVLTEEIKQFSRRFVRGRSVSVIRNPVREMEIPTGNESDAGDRRRVVTAMGRLEHQKGFDLLIEVFARLANRREEWNLQILGEGSQRAQLEKQIRDLKLDERILLSGWSSCPEEILGRSGLFVLSSRFEGFPLGLLEAMACGLPVVSFACRSGPSEIISDGTNGVLVPPGDLDGLERALDRLMSDADERERLGKNALEVRERFSVSRYAEEWEQLFDSEQ